MTTAPFAAPRLSVESNGNSQSDDVSAKLGWRRGNRTGTMKQRDRFLLERSIAGWAIRRAETTDPARLMVKATETVPPEAALDGKRLISPSKPRRATVAVTEPRRLLI